MNEFIEKLIERLEKLKNSKVIKQDGKPYGRMTQLWRLFGINEAIDTVNQLAEEYAKDTYVQTIDVAELVGNPEQLNSGWIPCERELPPQPKENPLFDNKPLELYLVSDSFADYPFRAFWNGKFFADGFSSVDVIAWQPLPVPYQPKGDQLCS